LFIAKIAAEVESDRRVTVKKLARTHGVSTKAIHAMLHKDLNISKKSARWVPKLLSNDMKKERVRTSEEFLKMVYRHSMSMLDNIVTMDKLSVSFHTTETNH
jgi:histone-lysine N-methyltransferase SETMAR